MLKAHRSRQRIANRRATGAATPRGRMLPEIKPVVVKGIKAAEAVVVEEVRHEEPNAVEGED